MWCSMNECTPRKKIFERVYVHHSHQPAFAGRDWTELSMFSNAQHVCWLSAYIEYEVNFFSAAFAAERSPPRCRVKLSPHIAKPARPRGRARAEAIRDGARLRTERALVRRHRAKSIIRSLREGFVTGP